MTQIDKVMCFGCKNTYKLEELDFSELKETFNKPSCPNCTSLIFQLIVK